MGRLPLGTAAIVAYEAIVRLCAADLPPLELLEKVARRVRSVVPYAAAGWMPTDPATLLWTATYAENVSPSGHLALIDNELTARDVGKFADVARLPRPVLRLSDATGGQLERSARYRDLYSEGRVADELRAAFRAGATCWGVVCLTRTSGGGGFTAAEIDFIARVGEHVAHGLRSSLRIAASQDTTGVVAPPGMLVLDDDDEVESLTETAQRWFGELPDEGLPLPSVVYGVARRARLNAGDGQPGPPARARVRLPSGRWLVVHAARLRPAGGGPWRTAVIVEPARRSDLAPLIVEMYGLTPRESEVAQMLVSGTATDQIARSLWVSQHTVRDHVKAVFAKLGVSSRPELTAMLFHEHFLPDLDVRVT